MKVAILAGGFGSRLAEETDDRPKPMVSIGDRPILWHIMKHYASHDFRDFVIATGHKGDQIHDYFRHGPGADEPWTVNTVDTGLKTQTGGRLKRLAPHLQNETFMLTWGDGLSDIDLTRILDFHRAHKKLATVTAVHPPPRFGQLTLQEDLEGGGDQVVAFSEKPLETSWINGAFFVLEPAVLDLIEDDHTHFERQPMERLAAEGQLMAYRHESFWQCMDTLRDKRRLEHLWQSGDAPWKTWY